MRNMGPSLLKRTHNDICCDWMRDSHGHVLYAAVAYWGRTANMQVRRVVELAGPFAALSIAEAGGPYRTCKGMRCDSRLGCACRDVHAVNTRSQLLSRQLLNREPCHMPRNLSLKSR